MRELNWEIYACLISDGDGCLDIFGDSGLHWRRRIYLEGWGNGVDSEIVVFNDDG
jgi:hypothetical protein